MAKYFKPRAVTLKPSIFHKLTLTDVMCPICHEIFIKPVTLPCFHGFCLQCFERTVEENALTCPLCRKRIGSWLRTVSKDGGHINQKLWEVVQQKFPGQVKAKLSGDDDGVEQVVVGNSVTDRHFSTPGEIKLEFEEHLRKLEDEARIRAEREEQESVNLIRQLQEEEERQLQQRRQQLLAQEQLDEQVARKLFENSEEDHNTVNHVRETRNHAYNSHQNSKRHHSIDSVHNNHLKNSPKNFKSKKHNRNNNHISKVQQSSEDRKNNVYNNFRHSQRGPMDAYVVPKKTLQESLLDDGIDLELLSVNGVNTLRSGRRHLMSNSSHDSINPEIHHFKPIRAMPLTPPKRFPDGSELIVRLVRSIPRNLNDVYNSRPESYTSTTITRQLKAIQLDRLNSAPTCSSYSFSSDDSDSKNVSSAFRGTGINKLRRKAETCLGNSKVYSLRKRVRSESADDESESSKSRNSNSVASVKSETFSDNDSRSSRNEDDVEERVFSSSSQVKNDEEDLTFTEEQWDLLNDLPDFDDENEKINRSSRDDENEKRSASSREGSKRSASQSSEKTDVNNLEAFCNSKIELKSKTINNVDKIEDSEFRRKRHLEEPFKQEHLDYEHNGEPSCSTKAELESELSNEIIDKLEDSEFSREQRRLQEQLKQEQADYEYALKLSRELNTVDRRKGSNRAYELRSINRQSNKKRQRKLEEYAGTSSTKH